MNDILLNDNFKKFLENLSNILIYINEKDLTNGIQVESLEIIKTLLNDLTKDEVNIIYYDFKLIKKLIEETIVLDKIEDEVKKKDCGYMIDMIQTALDGIIERVEELKTNGITEYIYSRNSSVQYIPPAAPPTPLEFEDQEQIYNQTLSELYTAMRQDCDEYLKKYISFSKKQFKSDNWEPEFNHLEALYAKTKTKMEKTFGQITGRLRNKECIIEVRQRALKTPNIISLQERIKNNPPKKPTIKIKNPLIIKGEELSSQINEIIYRIGYLPQNHDFNEVRSTSLEAIKKFNILVASNPSNEALKTSISNLKNLYQSLYQTFVNVEAERKKTQKQIDEALQRKLEYETNQKAQVLDNKKLNKFFYNNGTKIGKYTGFLLDKKTQPFLQELKRVQFEYGYGNSEYEAVAKQFLDQATNYLGKRKTKKLMKELKKANIVLSGANRIEIPAFLLDADILAHTSDGKKRK